MKKEKWCEHIVLVDEQYEIYNKYVPSEWKYCPVCGERRP